MAELTVARALVTWLVAVPLAGAAWTAMLSSRGRAARAARPEPEEGSPSRTSAFRGSVAAVGRSWRDGNATSVTASAGALASITLAALLGTEALLIVVLSLGVVFAGWLVRAAWVAPVGWARSMLEVTLPALLGWFAMHGPEAVPAPVLVYDGAWQAASEWLLANWLFPVVVVAFTMVYHGSTSVTGANGRRSPQRRVAEIVVAYSAVIGALAFSNRPVAAGVLALLFVVQWPILGLLFDDRDRQHLAAAKLLAMAAMLVASVSAGAG